MPDADAAQLRVLAFFDPGGSIRIRRIGEPGQTGVMRMAAAAGVAVAIACAMIAPKALASGGQVFGGASRASAFPSRNVSAFVNIQRLYDDIHSQVVSRTGDCETPVYLVSGKGKMTGDVVAKNGLFVAIAANEPGSRAVFVHPLSRIVVPGGVEIGDHVTFFMNDVDGLSEIYQGNEEPSLPERIQTMKSPDAQSLLHPEVRGVDRLVK